MPINRKLEYTILDMIESANRNSRVGALNLGGYGGGGGGVGGPPGGFIGRLPQYQVAYDETEAATLDTLPSGEVGSSGWSLVDNLNHIRYRVSQLEGNPSFSGIIVVDDNTVNTYNDIDTIHFSGAGITVTNLGNGEVSVVVTATGSGGGTIGSGDSTYLRLDATNDPLTGALDINAPLKVTTYDFDLYNTYTNVATFTNRDPNYNATVLNVRNVYGGTGAYISVARNYSAIAGEQAPSINGNIDYPLMEWYRYSDGSTNTIFQAPYIHLLDYSDVGISFTEGTLKHSLDNVLMVGINPYAPTDGKAVFINSQNSINPVGGRLLSLNNQGNEVMGVNGGGGILVVTSGNTDGMYITSRGNWSSINLWQASSSNIDVSQSTVFMYRGADDASDPDFTGPMIWGQNGQGVQEITGDFLLFDVWSGGSHEKFRVDKDGNAYTRGVRLNTREQLTATRNYYVRTDGNDSNTGLTNTSGGAFLTIQKAIDVIAGTLDLAGQTAIINVADGTYTGLVSLKEVIGYSAPGCLQIVGNVSTPTNVFINCTGSAVVASNINAVWDIKSLKIAATVRCLSGDNATVRFSAIDFASSTHHIAAFSGGKVIATGNYTVSGNATRHIWSESQGLINVATRTITFSNSPVFTVFCYQFGLSFVQANGMTFTNGGTVTGQRYDISLNSACFVNGAGPNYLPGNSAGTTATGGQYA